MIEKKTIIESIEANPDGIITVREKVVFLESGGIVNECIPTERMIYPGDIPSEDESEKVKNMVNIFHDNITIAKYKHKKRMQSMGYDSIGE